MAPHVFAVIAVLGSLVFIPSPVLTFTAGSLFGMPVGFAVISAAMTVSAGGVFLAGRALSRKWLIQKIARHPRTQALNDAVSHEGWKMVALLRQTGVLPFSIMNYALGLSKISFKDYLIATWLGMMPGQLLYTYLGATLQSKKTAAEWFFAAAGLLVTIGISVRATFIVKKALRTYNQTLPNRRFV